MELATAALSSLLPKLATLLSDEYKLQKGVRGEIRFLQAEMESMQAALERVSKLPARQIDELNKIWVRDLKELVYDIEDSVDSFMVCVDTPVHDKPHSFRKFFDRTIGLLTKAKSRHHIADDIQDIKERIDVVSKRRERYNSSYVVVQPDSLDIDPRMPSLYGDAAKLVGIDGPSEKIVDLLTRGEGVRKQKLRVVSIVGMGGLGKTTIANSVYERLGGQFDCRAFVSVSLKPDMKQILSSILRQVSQDKCTNAGEKDRDELLRSIKNFLMDKRYFIVIDDLWGKKAWEIIKSALIDKNIGSRIIVTTRKLDVASFSAMDGEVYELDPLSHEDSKKLLCKRVFEEEDIIYSGLEEVTNKILKKCGGIPLAIITIASMLASIPNRTKYEWYGVYNSMGSGLEKDKTLDNMRKILHLSYDDMPSYLKPCLLYLSMFPEDYNIPRSDLVGLWVAEGFVVDKPGSNSYAIAERYFNELINRSMIMPFGIKFGVAACCRVHDMILDLLISLSVEENFVTISKGPQINSTLCKSRRISLQIGSKREETYEKQTMLQGTVNMTHARSLIAFGDAVQWMPPLSRFSILRVLSLKSVTCKIIHSKDLGSLHHLRYLELGGQFEPDILEGIGNLKLLKILDLWDLPIKELPTCITHLQKLEQLLIDSTMRLKLPDRIGNLTSLQVLSVLDVEKSANSLAELSKLAELQVLRIQRLDESHTKAFLRSLSNLCNLRTLEFRGADGPLSLDSVSDNWRGPAHLQVFDGQDTIFTKLPRWFTSFALSELSSLSIWVNVLRQVDLKLLGALPGLRFLQLRVNSKGTTEERLVIGSVQPFRSLADFEFWDCSRYWLVFGQGVMPRLQNLLLSFYAEKKDEGIGFDVGLENLSSLKHVTVHVECKRARTRVVEDVETKIRDAVSSHPNHPTLVLKRHGKRSMVDDERKDENVASEQQSVES